MKFKRIIILMLSLSLLLPSFAMASDHGEHDHEEWKTDVATPAGDLRAHLDYLFSEHAFLAITAMQKGIDGAEDFEATAASLNENTEGLTAAIEGVYGAEAGEAFNEMWNDHIGFFVDYVMATAEENDEAKEEALNNLSQYRDDFAEFLSGATDGKLPVDDLANGLQMHVDDLIGAFDSYVEGDNESAYQQVRDAYAHMFHVSKDLSWAITEQFPEEFDNTTVDTPAVETRSHLSFLFSEHTALAILTMQKGVDGAEDFDTAAWALDENTADLSAAVESFYGAEAGEAFHQMWDEHIGFFVDYVTATVEENDEAREEALNNLENYRDDFAAFLSGATDGNLPEEDLANGLQAHVDQVTMAFDSYVEGDFDTAYSSVREAIHHMYMPAEGLAAALVAQFPEEFESDAMPEEMPQTGMGGASAASGDSLAVMWVTMGALLALLTLVFIRKRASNEQ